jgi:UDP-N-acetylglucosamine 4,6-dehydratase
MKKQERYLIIGGTGSLGKKLIERLLPTDEVIVYSRDEAKHFTIKNELANHPQFHQLSFFVGDVRDTERLKNAMRQLRPTIILVAAALKQVDTCELSPSESIATNLSGTQNVIDAINDVYRAESLIGSMSLRNVLFVSTDKACAPVNVYGMCKALSERVVTSQSLSSSLSWVKFMCVRYGNVLESRGSIIPLFKYQAENAAFLTVTDPNMTRFLMTLDNSVDLILHALEHGQSGETWIPMLPSMRIGDLAELFSEMSQKPIRIIGLRPGEKQHEDLINESESVRTTKTDEHPGHYVIQPAYKPGSGTAFSYTSADNVMNKQQLREHLTSLGIFSKPLDQFTGASVEEIATNRKD